MKPLFENFRKYIAESRGEVINSTNFRLPKEMVDAFCALATQQRGVPEDTMNHAQSEGLSNLYTWALEHTGDLIHRMSKNPEWHEGGYDMVGEKVDKLLRILTNPYGFEKESLEQIEQSIKY